jgi:hypothetical protein
MECTITLPEHMISPIVFSGVHVAQSLAFCLSVTYGRSVVFTGYSGFWQVGGFLRALWFPPQKKTWLPQYNWNIVERGVKHLKPKAYIANEGCDVRIIFNCDLP